jgi:hypothetical protein
MRFEVVMGLALSCSTWASSGSLYRGECTHVGVRPASDGPGDYALTLQISTDEPACARSRPDAEP